jgi:aspartyl-tRNA(Asn)/glutamyl-tRNA(Gln) amidotransferase subunit A
MTEFAPLTPLADLLRQLETGETTSAALTEAALERARDPAGEGARAFTALYEDGARAQAAAVDALRAAGVAQGPLAGLPVSIKDLFDVAGEVTRAGSIVRDDAPPAERDAPVVRRLRAAGAVIVGRTNMTEFAYSGVGLNPHYGTPANPWDRANRRIPGGSSSGAAVSVADAMATVGIGTDTGGSVRIPSALNGLTGFKPTARRVPTEGAFPLSHTLDSIGPLAPTVACCALVDAVLAGDEPAPVAAQAVEGLRLAVPQTLVFDGIEEGVAGTIEAALSRLSAAGARITEIPFESLSEIPKVSIQGGFAAAEAYAIHRADLETRRDRFDPRVASRIDNGKKISSADYVDLLAARRRLCAVADRTSAPFDALVLPTTPRVAPPIADLEDSDAVYGDTNLAMLRNNALFNFLDRCAASLPCHAPGDAPVGLMVVGETMGDRRLLSVARAIEGALRH